MWPPAVCLVLALQDAPPPTPATAAPPEPARAAPADALPAGLAARFGEHAITLEEYRDYLVLLYARGPLQRMIDARLVRSAAERSAVVVTAAELEEAVETTWRSYLERFHGDEQGFVQEIARQGFTRDDYRAYLREEKEVELLAGKLCQRTRVVDEDAVRARFERLYGVDGQRVEVRHVFLAPARLRADLQRAGAPPGELEPDAVAAALDARARAILAELADGADFAAVAARESHDISAPKNGGALADYNYRTYGEEFASAVRAAEVGVPVGPVRTRAGVHVIEVTSRTATDLAAVRDEIAAALAAEPATWSEIEALKARLRSEVEIRTY